MFPSADRIAIALVTACRLAGGDPAAAARGLPEQRGRHVALAALLEAYPEARRASLARCCGYPAPRAGQAAVITARKSKWWNEIWVDETVGALVADQYGERAG